MTESNKTKSAGIHERRHVPAGTVIVKEGETGTSAFLIQAGRVSVLITDPKTQKQVEIATLEPGHIFGDMALITDCKRSATVKAVDDCNLIVITRGQLEKKLEKSDPTIRALVPMLIKRLTQTNEALVHREYSVEDMMETIKSVYDSVSAPLVPSKKKTFENLVKPKMDEFLLALKSYRSRHEE